jgi:hypothetical protein
VSADQPKLSLCLKPQVTGCFKPHSLYAHSFYGCLLTLTNQFLQCKEKNLSDWPWRYCKRLPTTTCRMTSHGCPWRPVCPRILCTSSHFCMRLQPPSCDITNTQAGHWICFTITNINLKMLFCQSTDLLAALCSAWADCSSQPFPDWPQQTAFHYSLLATGGESMQLDKRGCLAWGACLCDATWNRT